MRSYTEDYERDKELVAKVLRGDHSAFTPIIKNSERMVVHIFCSMIKSKEDQKDLAQEVYLKVFKNLGGFKFQSKLSTWICQITYNTCLNHLAKKSFARLDDSMGQQDAPQVSDRSPDSSGAGLGYNIEYRLFNDDLSAILDKEINKLTPIYQTMIGLFHQEEMTYADIAQITRLPEGTVKSYLFRARKTLKENILLNYKPEDL